MIKKCGVNQDQWRVKYWARNILVLLLYSSVTVGKIFLVGGQKYQTTQVVLCLVLFFMRVHLVSVNFKGKFHAKESVIISCSYFLLFLHIYGVHITPKRNWLSECFPLCFLIMRSDIAEPHLLTSKTYEHTNYMIRGMQRGMDCFTVITKIQRIWTATMKCNMKPKKNERI